METGISVSVWVSQYPYGDSLYGNFRLRTFYEFVGGTMCLLLPRILQRPNKHINQLLLNALILNLVFMCILAALAVPVATGCA